MLLDENKKALATHSDARDGEKKILITFEMTIAVARRFFMKISTILKLNENFQNLMQCFSPQLKFKSYNTMKS